MMARTTTVLVIAAFLASLLPGCGERCGPGFRLEGDTCEVWGTSVDGLGESCTKDSDCTKKGMETHVCVMVPGDSEGYCAQEGCDLGDDNCPDGYICLDLSSYDPARTAPVCVQVDEEEEDGIPGMGDTCKDHPDCTQEADTCVVVPGNETGFCTIQHCTLDPDDCPEGYTCFDASAIEPDADTICLQGGIV